MITYMQGDIFDSKAQTLVNTVNTVGVMGKGLALQFKRRYPVMYDRYCEMCRAGLISIGNPWIYRTSLHKWILCFPTKDHWCAPSRLEYIEAGLQRFVTSYSFFNIESIAFPPLGCGNGGLDWNGQVGPLMSRLLGDLPIDIYIYAPEPTCVHPWLRGRKIGGWLV